MLGMLQQTVKGGNTLFCSINHGINAMCLDFMVGWVLWLFFVGAEQRQDHHSEKKNSVQCVFADAARLLWDIADSVTLP